MHSSEQLYYILFKSIFQLFYDKKVFFEEKYDIMEKKGGNIMNYLVLSYDCKKINDPHLTPNILMSTNDLKEAEKWEKIYKKNRYQEKIILVKVNLD